MEFIVNSLLLECITILNTIVCLRNSAFLEDYWEICFFLRGVFALLQQSAQSHLKQRPCHRSVTLSVSKVLQRGKHPLILSNTIKSSCNWEEVYYYYNTSSSTPQHFPVSVLRAIFACSPSVHPLLSIDPSWSYHHQKLITFSWQHRPLHLLFSLLDVLI